MAESAFVAAAVPRTGVPRTGVPRTGVPRTGNVPSWVPRTGAERKAAEVALPAAGWVPVVVDVAVADWSDVEGIDASGTELTEFTVGDVTDSVTVTFGWGANHVNVEDPPGVTTRTVVAPTTFWASVAVMVVGLVTE